SSAARNRPSCSALQVLIAGPFAIRTDGGSAASCGVELRDWVELRWGLCSDLRPPDVQYRVGDRLRWGRNELGFIPTGFRFSDLLSNLGFPTDTRLRVLDRSLERRCPHCSATLGVIATDVVLDTVVTVQVDSADHYVDGIDYYVEAANGLVPYGDAEHHGLS